ncbi:MAG: hypothetical protein KC635_01360, partial [Myxococcales bacterium]|nr:hypothetical protein [Myxococcales bacterium]
MESADRSWPARGRLAVGLALAALLAVALPASPALAAVSPSVAYRGTLLDVEGRPVEGLFDLTFTLYDAESGGASLVTLAANAVDVQDGLFSVDVGALFEGIDGATWLEIGVRGAGESDFDTLPRVQVTSVPSALRAGVADRALAVPWEGVEGAPTPLQGPKGDPGEQGP